MEEVILSNGKKAVIKDGKGKDLFEAMRIATEPGEVPKLLLARLIEINGKAITEDDLEELPLQDVVALLNAVTKMLPFAPAQRSYSASSKKDFPTKS